MVSGTHARQLRATSTAAALGARWSGIVNEGVGLFVIDESAAIFVRARTRLLALTLGPGK